MKLNEVNMYHYTDGGLKNVWLENGYEIRKTPYGKGVAIHDVDGLVGVICSALVKKKSPLTGVEFRYLRSAGMLLSQDGLGKLLGVDAQTIARWEKTGRAPKWANDLIRVHYINHADGNETIKSVISRITTVERLINQKIVVRESRKGGWRSDLISDDVAHA